VIVLASKSAARAQVLTGAGVPFEAVGAGVNEDALKGELLAHDRNPAQIAAALAEAKALAVAWERDELVIGCDQTLEFEGALFDKPKDMGEARERLLAMRGKSHQLHSAVVVARGNDIRYRELDTTQLTMRDFSEAWLDGYLERVGEGILTSVGCYQLEGEGVQLFERIEGDFFSILGLPLMGLLEFLRGQKVIGS
jgi:septum formation protein